MLSLHSYVKILMNLPRKLNNNTKLPGALTKCFILYFFHFSLNAVETCYGLNLLRNWRTRRQWNPLKSLLCVCNVITIIFPFHPFFRVNSFGFLFMPYAMMVPQPFPDKAIIVYHHCHPSYLVSPFNPQCTSCTAETVFHLSSVAFGCSVQLRLFLL